jgi:hypothetical protein
MAIPSTAKIVTTSLIALVVVALVFRTKTGRTKVLGLKE